MIFWPTAPLIYGENFTQYVYFFVFPSLDVIPGAQVFGLDPKADFVEQIAEEAPVPVRLRQDTILIHKFFIEMIIFLLLTWNALSAYQSTNESGVHVPWLN